MAKAARIASRSGLVPLALAALLVATAARAENAGLAAFDEILARLGAPSGLAPVLADAETRLAPHFAANGIPYPPPAAAFIALKDEGRLELWAQAREGWRFVRSYLIRKASGRLGPKLREGDRQVPEGVYHVSALNPNSRYHLSLRLDYPNDFDRARAAEEGRTDLGGDIMIHGSRVSIGCIPVGDVEIEELFALAARVGAGNVRVVVSPLDLRRASPDVAAAQAAEQRPWLGALYAAIARELADFPLAPGEAPPAIAPHPDADPTWALLEGACAVGDATGCAELGRLHLADDGLRRDVTLAAAFAGAACDAGDGDGCAELGRLCAERLLYPGPRAACVAAPDGRTAPSF